MYNIDLTPYSGPAEVLDTIRYLVGSDAPFPEHRPLGEWECGNGDCAVRAVTIRAKTAGAPEGFPPDILHCPACQLPLTFRRWLREKTLIPADRVPSQIV